MNIQPWELYIQNTEDIGMSYHPYTEPEILPNFHTIVNRTFPDQSYEIFIQQNPLGKWNIYLNIWEHGNDDPQDLSNVRPIHAHHSVPTAQAWTVIRTYQQYFLTYVMTDRL